MCSFSSSMSVPGLAQPFAKAIFGAGNAFQRGSVTKATPSRHSRWTGAAWLIGGWTGMPAEKK